LLFSLAVMAFMFPISLLLHHFIERPGVGLGKRLLAHRAAVVQSGYYPMQKPASATVRDITSQA
jgi:peptidoglycan/LPS O-acetylase OafA/YrhL